MKTTYTSMQHPGQMPGAYWKIDDIDLAITDGGYSLMKQFINENPHEDFNLSIYDAITHTTAEIYCSRRDAADSVGCLSSRTCHTDDVYRREYYFGVLCGRHALHKRHTVFTRRV